MYAARKSFSFTGAISRVPTPFSLLACFDATPQTNNQQSAQVATSNFLFFFNKTMFRTGSPGEKSSTDSSSNNADVA
jgi:hypothetical protein